MLISAFKKIMYYFLDKLFSRIGYLIFPALALVVYLWSQNQISWWLALIWIALGAIFVYARFFEPQKIKIIEENFAFLGSEADEKKKNIRVVLIADQHLGVFKGPAFLKRTVEKINQLNPDLVLIAGDLIYDPREEELKNLYRVITEIRVPIYAVAGNHDSEEPGYISSDRMREAVSPFKVNFIDNKKVTLNFEDKELNIYGLSDYDENKMSFAELEKIRAGEEAIILTHNPDVSRFLPNYNAGLMLAGHTHGGQIKIPWLYKKLIPSLFGFDRGWYRYKGLKIFVTSGLGEVLLPIRFLVPPEIVLINLQI